MATGLVSALGNNSSVTYTPNSDAKLLLACAGTAATNVTVNTVVVFAGTAATNTNALVTLYVGAGVAVTIATGASNTCLVSSLEAI